MNWSEIFPFTAKYSLSANTEVCGLWCEPQQQGIVLKA